MSLGCARCGDCCVEIWIDSGISSAAGRLGEGDESVLEGHGEAYVANLRFMAENWRPTGDRDRMATRVQVRCDQYDAVEKLCMAHDSRPPVCSDFPWYGREPGMVGDPISPRCSYWLDVTPKVRPRESRPLIPLTARTAS